MIQHQPSGSFAPPLADDKMASYRKLIDAMEPSATKDAMDYCWRCCDAWWNQPDSSGNGSYPHPRNPSAIIVPLDESIIQAIDPHTPWMSECENFGLLFEQLQKGEAERNSAKVQAWVTSVIEHLKTQMFPEKGFYERLTEAMSVAAKWVFLLGESEKQKFEEQQKKVHEYVAEVQKVVKSKTYGPIPYPQLESTELRDAAHHLLWHAKELTNDREPITSDLLKKD